MKLTPLQMNAAAGLLQNEGLCANTQQNNGKDIYLNSSLIAPLISTIEIGSNNGSLAQSTISTLSTLSPACPALSNTDTENVSVVSGASVYTTLGITSLVGGKMIANIIPPGTDVKVVCSDGNICIGNVDICKYKTPVGNYTNLIDANVQSKYTKFDLLACFKGTNSAEVESASAYEPFIIADFIEKGSNAWVGNCWVTESSYDKFAEKLLDLYLGKGDYTIFAQAFNLVQGYIRQANQFIGAADIGPTYLANTFDGMSDLITGSISSINPNIKGFSQDLTNLGKAINMDDLESLGSPLALVRQIIKVAGYLPILSLSFLTVGIPQHTVGSIGSFSSNVSDETQRLMYQALRLITGDALSQVLKILQVKTENLSSAADLLDPSKMFPNSYTTLKVPTADGYQNVYSSGAVNTSLKTRLPPYVVRSTA